MGYFLKIRYFMKIWYLFKVVKKKRHLKSLFGSSMPNSSTELDMPSSRLGASHLC